MLMLGFVFNANRHRPPPPLPLLRTMSTQLLFSSRRGSSCLLLLLLYSLFSTTANGGSLSSITSNNNRTDMIGEEKIEDLAALEKAIKASQEAVSKIGDTNGGLKWVDLSVSSYIHRKRKFLLHPSHGFVPNGFVCGILGPSGAGKSTLLSALGGHTPHSLHLTGSVWYQDNNSETYYLSTGDGEVALLQQSDNFFSMLTPKETIDLAAQLQLPYPKHERAAIVNRILESLGLKADQHRIIGERSIGASSTNKGGLSGGERRRLSVGLELVTAPKVLLADEATTGLDSTQAEKVVELMRKLSKERHIPCICTLHQPRASIWRKLDMIILLAPGGKLCYIGDRILATDYFAALGYKCPNETNPAEFLIDLVSVDYEDEEEAEKDMNRIEYLASCFQQNHVIPTNEEAIYWKPPTNRNMLWNFNTTNDGLILQKKRVKGGINFIKRFGALLTRSWRQNIRDGKLNLFRLLASIGQALFFAQKYRSVKPGLPTAKSLADRTALLSFGVINMSMLAIMKSLELFGREKTVVTRERMRQQYSGFEYLLSKVLAEFPLDAFFATAFAAILKWKTGLQCSLQTLCATYSLMTVAGASLGFAVGSFTSNVETARVVGFPLMVLFMVVGVINPSGLSDADEPEPGFIRFIKFASPIRWAIEALCIAEYTGMEFAPDTQRRGWFGNVIKVFQNPRMGALALVQNGGQVLDAIGLTGATYESHMKNLAILTGINLLITLFGLTFCGPKFKQANMKGGVIADRALDLEEVDADFTEEIQVEIAEKTEKMMSKTASRSIRKPEHAIPTFRGPI